MTRAPVSARWRALSRAQAWTVILLVAAAVIVLCWAWTEIYIPAHACDSTPWKAKCLPRQETSVHHP